MIWIKILSQNILVAEFPITVIFATWLTMEMALIKYFIHNNWLKASSVSLNVSLSNSYVHIIYLSFKCTTAHVQILESADKWQHNFQGVLMSGSFFQRVFAIVCQGTLLACCVLKSLNKNTQNQSWKSHGLRLCSKATDPCVVKVPDVKGKSWQQQLGLMLLYSHRLGQSQKQHRARDQSKWRDVCDI